MSDSQQEIHIDQLIRSKRRTISLEINQDGSLIVRAPQHAPIEEIHTLVNSKKNWIIKKQNLAYELAQEAPPKQFVSGEMFLYLGKLHQLNIVADQVDPLVLNGNFLLAAESQRSARQVFEIWYRKQAAQVIKPRTAILAEQNGFTVSIIRINGAKTRWGSCGPKGSLNFPYRLVMAPEDVIDYVIIHELVHLRTRDHSKSYWRVVQGIMPDYKTRLNWLQENGHRLSLD
jgi:predicted metal-dependent hydrolase